MTLSPTHPPNPVTIAGPLPPFILPLRNAIRIGDKTVTRRVLKPQPPTHAHLVQCAGNTGPDTPGSKTDTLSYGAEFRTDTGEQVFYRSRYGIPGECRYLREPLARGQDGNAYYLDDNQPVLDQLRQPVPWRWKVSRLAQLYMPAEFARTLVVIRAIRVEQLCRITAADAVAEGIRAQVCLPGDADPHSPQSAASAREQVRYEFQLLWDSLNAERGFSWESNPWVWVIAFENFAPVYRNPAKLA